MMTNVKYPCRLKTCAKKLEGKSEITGEVALGLLYVQAEWPPHTSPHITGKLSGKTQSEEKSKWLYIIRPLLVWKE